MKMYKKRSEFADKISIGDKEVDFGSTIAEIIDKKVESSELQVVTESGQVYRRFSTINKDITLKVRIYAYKVGNDLFFDEQKLKISNTITIDTEKMEISGLILDILDVEQN